MNFWFRTLDGHGLHPRTGSKGDRQEQGRNITSHCRTQDSAIKDELGRWQIEPAELHRVYPPKGEAETENVHQPNHDQTAEIERLKATVEGLERLCRQIKRPILDPA
jgi:hypothetical protein